MLWFVAVVAAQPCLPEWSDEFETTDNVFAATTLASFDDGSGPALFVGVTERTIGSQVFKGLAKWNGVSWNGVGGSLSTSFGTPYVYTMLPFPDGAGWSLMVAGEFEQAGTVSVSPGIARWNGTNWLPMTGYFEGAPAVATLLDRGTGPQAYAAGPRPSGFGDQAVARWTGATWSPIATLAPSTTFPGTARVHAMCQFGSGTGAQLFIGGNIGFVNGILINGLAKWNGTSWSSAGVLEGSYVNAMTLHDDGSGPALYIGGFFSSVGGVAATSIAKWNGTAWSAVGNQLTFGTDISGLCSFDPDGPGGQPAKLYAIGRMQGAGALSGEEIVCWDGVSWSPLETGLFYNQSNAPTASALEVSSVSGTLTLYVGGTFARAGGLYANHLAGWSGQAWTPIHRGINGQVNATASFQGRTVIGGTFTAAGQHAALGLAEWDGQWRAVGTGVSAPASQPLTVNDLLVHSDGKGEALFVAGNFTLAGGITSRGVARWSGLAWTNPAPTGPAFTFVTDLAVIDDAGVPRIHALGRLTTSTNNRTDLAKLVNGQWVPIGPTMFFTGSAVASFDTGAGPAYYVGGVNGSFPTLARLGATTWTTISTGGGSITRLFNHSDAGGPMLLATGRLTSVNSVPVSNVAALRSNGVWSAFGSLPDATVQTLSMHDEGSGPVLRAAGTHSPTGGPARGRLWNWDGAAWQTEVEASGPIRAMHSGRAENRPVLVLGGTFASMNGIGSSNISMWYGCDPPCPANCDQSTGTPVLTANDFQCFLNAYAAGLPSANCDGSMGNPVLTANDFQCFLNLYAAGCP